jgi:undecaprenyl pyrophosphate synthase
MRRIAEISPVTIQSASEQSNSPMELDALVSLCERKYKEKAEFDTNTNTERSLSHQNDQHQVPAEKQTSDEVEQNKQDQEKPWGANNNIHGFKTFGLLSTSKKLRKFGNVSGFTD